MAGISSNALKGSSYPKNRKEYNGIEHTTDLDINQYDAFYRNLDPQIGRWNQGKIEVIIDKRGASEIPNNIKVDLNGKRL